MGKLAIISFSLTGVTVAQRVQACWEEKGWETENVWKSAYLPQSLEDSVREWTARRFSDCELLVFVGACAIAVRSIAPFVKSKKTDPAVLVVDECGRYVISLLSGHLGGANEMALRLAEFLGAEAVVTTATDLHRQFAVDVFARQNRCEIFPMEEAKAFSAALLSGEAVGFYSDFPWGGELPRGVTAVESPDPAGNPEIGMALTVRRDCKPFRKTVYVVPKVVTAGVGCRKGSKEEAIGRMAEKAFQQAGIWPESLRQAASIDLKARESGILSWCEKKGIPFYTYSKEALMGQSGTFTPSAFVREVTGVENVCERSAVKAAKSGNIVQRKIAGDGVTFALVLSDWSVHFE
ncbi:MAG: cobalt-precorrin 5A hydrolase [Blautia sp.]